MGGANGSDDVMLSSVLNPDLRKDRGRRSRRLAKRWEKTRDAVMDLVSPTKAESAVITSIMSEDDVRTALRHPLVGVGTDSGAQAEDGKLSESKSHPRAWGSFPRILGKYVRDEHVLTLEEAVRKMTSKAADRVHLSDRGLLRPGMKADVTISIRRRFATSRRSTTRSTIPRASGTSSSTDAPWSPMGRSLPSGLGGRCG